MLDPRTLDQLEELMLTARRLVDGLFAGEHPSPRHGPGVEFHDYRPFAPGDDPAAIDWRVYGRTDRLYVRRFEHHAELPAVVLLDGSASMDWPDPSPAEARADRKRQATQRAGTNEAVVNKLAHARQLAAALALVLLRQGDPLVVAGWAGRFDHWVELPGAAGELNRLETALQNLGVGPGESEPAPEDDGSESAAQDPATLAAGLHALAGRLNRRSLVIVLSDWLDPPGPLLEAVARLTGAGHEVLALQLLAPAELSLDRLAAGPVRLTDPENGATGRADPRRDADRYRRALDRHLTTLRQGLTSAHSDYVLLPTDQPPIANLRQVLEKRAPQ